MEIVVKEGLDGFSMHKLAADVGISVNTIYLNFKNKEDLIIQVYQGVVENMEQVLLKGFDPEMDLATGLKLQWKNRLRYFTKYPLQIEFTEQIRHSPIYEKVMQVQGKNFSATMEQFYEKAIKNKELIPFPLEVYWSLAYAPLFQLLKILNDQPLLYKFWVLPDNIHLKHSVKFWAKIRPKAVSLFAFRVSRTN